MSGSSEPHKFCLWAKKYPVCKRTYKRNVDDTKLKKKKMGKQQQQQKVFNKFFRTKIPLNHSNVSKQV